MERKILSVIDDIRIHHLYDDDASVEFKLVGNILKVLVFNEEGRTEIASIELPGSEFEC